MARNLPCGILRASNWQNAGAMDMPTYARVDMPRAWINLRNIYRPDRIVKEGTSSYLWNRKFGGRCKLPSTPLGAAACHRFSNRLLPYDFGRRRLLSKASQCRQVSLSKSFIL